MAKQIVLLEDQVSDDIVDFFDHAESECAMAGGTMPCGAARLPCPRGVPETACSVVRAHPAGPCVCMPRRAGCARHGADVANTCWLCSLLRTLAPCARVFSIAVHGRTIQTVEDNPVLKEAFDEGRSTVTYEARVLKDIFLRLI